MNPKPMPATTASEMMSSEACWWRVPIAPLTKRDREASDDDADQRNGARTLALQQTDDHGQ